MELLGNSTLQRQLQQAARAHAALASVAEDHRHARSEMELQVRKNYVNPDVLKREKERAHHRLPHTQNAELLERLRVSEQSRAAEVAALMQRQQALQLQLDSRRASIGSSGASPTSEPTQQRRELAAAAASPPLTPSIGQRLRSEETFPSDPLSLAPSPEAESAKDVARLSRLLLEREQEAELKLRAMQSELEAHKSQLLDAREEGRRAAKMELEAELAEVGGLP